MAKEDIDFPRYCLFFIREIQKALDEGIENKKGFIEANIDSLYPYCDDAFDLITRTFERKGINVMIPTFRMIYMNGETHYVYKWKFRKLNKADDLPF